jgi:hypothetical protein
MFANFLRGPDAKTVSLETIGLVAGSKSFGQTGTAAQWGQGTAAKTAKQIGKVLKRDSDVLDPELRRFLAKAQRGLTKLAETPDGIGTGKYETVAGGHVAVSVEKHIENPAWKPAVEAFQTSLAADAESTFSRLFKDQAEATAKAAAEAAVKATADKDPAVAIARAYASRP